MAEERQVKLARATGNGASVLDGTQELVVLERLEVVGSDSVDAVANARDFVYGRLQTSAIDIRIPGKAAQLVNLALEFLHDLAAHVPSGENCDDFQQSVDRLACSHVGAVSDVILGLAVKELKAQTRPHPLVERLFVGRHRCLAMRTGLFRSSYHPSVPGSEVQLFCAPRRPQRKFTRLDCGQAVSVAADN